MKTNSCPSSPNDSKPGEPEPAPKPTFSFAATMANLQKQKETPAPKPEDVRKPETSEEKQRRLRKEERRKLRVSFKSDDELVQVREFMHDPEEDMGHEDSQTRDVGDSRGEGQMLKMHKDLELMDEDEDYEPPEEIEPLPDWTIPQGKSMLFQMGSHADEIKPPILVRSISRNGRKISTLVAVSQSLRVRSARFKNSESRARS